MLRKPLGLCDMWTADRGGGLTGVSAEAGWLHFGRDSSMRQAVQVRWTLGSAQSKYAQPDCITNAMVMAADMSAI